MKNLFKWIDTVFTIVVSIIAFLSLPLMEGLVAASGKWHPIMAVFFWMLGLLLVISATGKIFFELKDVFYGGGQQ